MLQHTPDVWCVKSNGMKVCAIIGKLHIAHIDTTNRLSAYSSSSQTVDRPAVLWSSRISCLFDCRSREHKRNGFHFNRWLLLLLLLCVLRFSNVLLHRARMITSFPNEKCNVTMMWSIFWFFFSIQSWITAVAKFYLGPEKVKEMLFVPDFRTLSGKAAWLVGSIFLCSNRVWSDIYPKLAVIAFCTIEYKLFPCHRVRPVGSLSFSAFKANCTTKLKKKIVIPYTPFLP